jgi:hypothetical protein
MMAFDDLFSNDDFLIDPEDVREVTRTESWDTGNDPDIFGTGETPDIFTTKD